MKLSISLHLVSLFSLTSFDGFLFPEIKGLDWDALGFLWASPVTKKTSDLFDDTLNKHKIQVE